VRFFHLLPWPRQGESSSSRRRFFKFQKVRLFEAFGPAKNALRVVLTTSQCLKSSQAPAFCLSPNSELQLALKRLGNRGAGVRDLKTRRQRQRIVRGRRFQIYGIG
jgi:hypothetical protein